MSVHERTHLLKGDGTDGLGPFLTMLMQNPGVSSGTVGGRYQSFDSATTVVGQAAVFESTRAQERLDRVDAIPISIPENREEVAPAVQQIARQTDENVFFKLPWWQMLLSVLSFSLLYYCCFKPGYVENNQAIPDVSTPTPSSSIEVEAEREVEVHRPLVEFEEGRYWREVPRSELQQKVEISRLDREGREAATKRFQERMIEMRRLQEGVESSCTELMRLATPGSGKDDVFFREALTAGKSFDALGLTYFRMVQSDGEIPKKNEAALKETYMQAQQAYQRLNALKGEIREGGTLEKILITQHSSYPGFQAQYARGFPYALYLEDRDLSMEAFATFNQALAQWANGRNAIELSPDNSAYLTQHYLLALRNHKPLSLKPDEQREILEKGLYFVQHPGQEVRLSSHPSGQRITSTRTVEVRNLSGELEGVYRWQEEVRITFSPYRENPSVTLHREVTKLD
ncbi:MAG: hypothetical protein KDK69_01380 [Chlamydiia bacterium]|nr:hypothetical protein [Chlamydiia bacterium]